MDPIFILICIFVVLDMTFFVGGLLVETLAEKWKQRRKRI